MNSDFIAKAPLYKTARAIIGSASQVKTGEYVSIRFSHISSQTVWFMVGATERGKLPFEVAYPHYQLTDFCL